jgi:hypothetical protein
VPLVLHHIGMNKQLTLVVDSVHISQVKSRYQVITTIAMVAFNTIFVHLLNRNPMH